VDGNAQTGIVADFLPHCHRIALFHQRLTGHTDVLGQRNHQNVRLREFPDGDITGKVFVLLRMDAAKE
jgi:hypothetical protein